MKITPKKSSIDKTRLWTYLGIFIALVIFASVLTPDLGRHYDRRQLTIAELQSLKNAVQTFQSDNHRLPTQSEGLEVLVLRPTDLTNSWRGPYIDKISTDKWGTPYNYVLVPNPNSDDLPFNIISAGKDKQLGTDDDLDIYSAH